MRLHSLCPQRGDERSRYSEIKVWVANWTLFWLVTVQKRHYFMSKPVKKTQIWCLLSGTGAAGRTKFCLCLKHFQKLFRVFLAGFFGQITQGSSHQWNESQLSVHTVNNSLSITPEAGSNHLFLNTSPQRQPETIRKKQLTLTLTPKTLLVLHCGLRWHHCRGKYPDRYLIN